ncbi:uncharacterized protein MONBRDRAFT_12171 [Monosiga brevicollis MX1]|uniref:Uncharacterized protein n=1 Tax=Monosiga brevicollis TaxID=81824 RepID=A9VBF4_MONBE|nr:uncharacterized protein MONBRDRAFT_12171 [Monosiga brevicollis MX1]EDQ85177.1 predicted protein [Monosiga brevicollis MX1]|eukprot:XP_001750002.1 hypothetical protein [Monosiga brevicollis MX1]
MANPVVPANIPPPDDPNRINIIIVGDAGVGKTSFAIRYVNETFEQTTLNANQEMDSFHTARQWHDEVKNFGDSGVCVVLVGNKTDLPRLVSTEEGSALAKDLQVAFCEVSAKTGDSVDAALKAVLPGVLRSSTNPFIWTACQPGAEAPIHRDPRHRYYINYTGEASSEPMTHAQFDPQGQVVHIERIPPRHPTYAPLDTPLPADLAATLRALGTHQLFAHQVPVLEQLLENDTDNVALYMFPTKALAQDQLRSLSNYTGAGWLGDVVRAATLDADTSQSQREDIRQTGNIILTNPDMLHVTLLARHERWCRLFRTLRYVVLDEAHTYRGVFGSHVACVMRRLLRICSLYRNDRVQFICCSATLANPGFHFRQLVPLYGMQSRELCVVQKDGSPSGERLFALWNPTLDRAAVEDGAVQPTQKPPSSSAKSAASGPNVKSPKAVRAHIRRLSHGRKAQRSTLVSLFQTQEEDTLKRPAKSRAQPLPAAAADSENDSDAELDAAMDEFDAAMAGHIAHDPGRAATPPPTVAPPTDAMPIAGAPAKGSPRRAGKRVGHNETSTPHSPHVKVAKFKEEDSKITSPILETALLLSALTKMGVRTLTFSRVRKVSELILKYTRRDLRLTAPHLQGKVQAYRAGYTKETRRQIERQLFNGELLGTTATNALELGVDIGSLDVTLLLGFPSSVASMWQQAGRAGRGTNKALTIIVLFNSALDQYYARHGPELFQRPTEAAISDPDNPYVLREHLLCAAAELPLRLSREDVQRLRAAVSAVLGPGVQLASEAAVVEAARQHIGLLPTAVVAECQDLLLFGETAGDLAHALTSDGLLQLQSPGYVLPQRDIHPAANISLRTIEEDGYDVVVTPDMRKIDEVDARHALFETYQGAIFLHRGQTYLVTFLDHDNRQAHVQPVTVDYFTKPSDRSDVDVISAFRKRQPPLQAAWGTVQVKIEIYGYQKIRERTLELFDTVELEAEPVEYKTRGVWLDINPATKARQVNGASPAFVAPATIILY